MNYLDLHQLKINAIHEVADEFFENVRVFVQFDNPVEYKTLVALQGFYKGNTLDFHYNDITPIYEEPIYHLKKDLKKLISEAFDRMYEDGIFKSIKI